MKRFLCFLVLAATAFAQTPPVAAQPDLELQEILRLANDQAAFQTPGLSRRERRLAYDAANLALLGSGRSYLAKHSSGPGRAEVILALTGRGAQFIKTIDLRYDQDASPAYVTYDEDARRAYEKESRALLEGLRADVTATTAQRMQAGRSLAMWAIGEAGTAAELDRVQAQIEQLAAEGLDESSVRVLQSRMFYPYLSLGLVPYEPYLARLAHSPIETVRELATEAKTKFERRRDGLGQIKFVAADGREVDLAKWRGKVVLIDFWATWCAPCIAELPHLKKLHAQYHDKGFEVVGIALESTRVAPNDTPEQRIAKFLKAKQVLLDFTHKNEIPWAQHFDGEHPRNEFGTHFGIQEIPATFLLDQTGKLVSANARGEKLEAEVKRLLKL